MRLKLPALNRTRSGLGPALNCNLLVRVPIFLALLLLSLLFLSFQSPVSEAAFCKNYFDCNRQIEETKRKINELANQADSLAKQISYLDYQIHLSQLEIEAAEEQIRLLSEDIGDLSQRLERIGSFLKFQEKTFVTRARSAYIANQLSPFDIVLGSEDLDEAVRRIKYLKVLEAQDREVLEQMKDIRTEYNEQKKILGEKKADTEELKRQVEAHKVNLSNQRASKNQLLAITRGEESRYRQYLKGLEIERQAILEALRSAGTYLGPVKKGQPVARQGNTGCSFGPHIHYSVHRSKSDLSELNPCSFVGVVGGKCSSPYWYDWWGTVVSGSFHRPASSSNWLAQSYWWFHKALDVVSRDGWVYASADGKAYLVHDKPGFRSYCIKYIGAPYNGVGYGVRIEHDNGTVTSYWHIQPK